MSDSRLKGIECRLDSIDENLKTHMRRTDTLETYVKDNDNLGTARTMKTFTWIMGVGITCVIAFCSFMLSMLIQFING